MSMGFGGYMNLLESDDTFLIYSYCCYNLNNENFREMKEKEDGEIYITRESLVEPEIHQKLKRMPSGRKKLIVKRIHKDFSMRDLFQEGCITVKNASGTWKTNADGIDIMACRLIYKLFYEYQDSGIVPNCISIFS